MIARIYIIPHLREKCKLSEKRGKAPWQGCESGQITAFAHENAENTQIRRFSYRNSKTPFCKISETNCNQIVTNRDETNKNSLI